MTDNVQYNSALRQSKAIRSELSKLNDKAAPTPAEVGNVSASLASFTKTLDEYNHLARQEIVTKKQEEAFERVKRFREDLSDFRSQVDGLKKAREDSLHQDNRNELLGRRPYNATPENPYANATTTTTTNSAFQPRNPTSYGGGPLTTGSADEMREAHALREQNFFANTHSALDDYIARGQAVLGDLGDQRDMLKNTQKRLYSVANTLGVSGETIRLVERRAREDKWIFFGLVIVFFVFCWLCIHYLTTAYRHISVATWGFNLNTCVTGLYILAFNLSQRYCEEHVPRRLYLDALGLREDVIARAQLATNLRLPVGHVPLQALGGDDARPLERQDTDVLAERHVLAILPDADQVLAGLQEERETRPGQEEQPALGVVGPRLQQVQVVQLADALVDAPSDAAQRDNVESLGPRLADPGDGLVEVGGFLVGDVDDLGRRGLRRVEVSHGGGQRVEVTDDGLEEQRTTRWATTYEFTLK
ncbi:Peroxisomal biogenesis factor 19 [Purpureocillium lavendulum]|uniref:Peroxisomal biogenesis factor 19 n=1 Tax=Purpureocillium lavendulum TaxID=1247861 RepID=A0AB34FP13_9HYPO|nr:Peroxisomal biogenesis factor 19 [Purpureocillium lavendulum]